MGRELNCEARWAGKRATGRALLETDELVFRGDFRVAVPLKDIRELAAKSGTLTVKFSGGRLELDLGSDAEKWAERIKNPPSLMSKLGVKPGLKIAALGLPEPLVQALRDAGSEVSTRAGTGRDLVFLYADAPADLAKVAAAKKALAPSGGVWIVRSTVDGRVTEADVMAAGRGAGLTDVKVARIDEALSALKFVIPKVAR